LRWNGRIEEEDNEPEQMAATAEENEGETLLCFLSFNTMDSTSLPTEIFSTIKKNKVQKC